MEVHWQGPEGGETPSVLIPLPHSALERCKAVVMPAENYLGSTPEGAHRSFVFFRISSEQAPHRECDVRDAAKPGR